MRKGGWLYNVILTTSGSYFSILAFLLESFTWALSFWPPENTGRLLFMPVTMPVLTDQWTLCWQWLAYQQWQIYDSQGRSERLDESAAFWDAVVHSDPEPFQFPFLKFWNNWIGLATSTVNGCHKTPVGSRWPYTLHPKAVISLQLELGQVPLYVDKRKRKDCARTISRGAGIMIGPSHRLCA